MKSIKRLLLSAICLAVFSIVSVNVYANSIPYNTSTSYHIITNMNGTEYDMTVTANTRPTVGNGGAIISITKPGGIVVASKLFPYYVSAEDLVAPNPAGTTRSVYVAPNIDEQIIQGTVTYNFY